MRLETPEEAGAGELEVLKGMVLAWKEDYSRSASPGGETNICARISPWKSRNTFTPT